MSRSFYRRLRALAGRKVDLASRREFLGRSLYGAAGVMLPLAWPGGTGLFEKKRVVVVGGGFAGLGCAYELRRYGYDVTVVEARSSVGGRVRSTDRFVAGRTVEVGGELIGLNHPTWLRFAKELGLELVELSEDETLEQPIWLGGRRLSREDAAKLVEEMDEVFLRIDGDAAPVVEDEPWKTPNARELDQRSTLQWLGDLEASELCKQALAVELYANNGQELGRQSYLGNLCQVKGGGGAQAYRENSETHRCQGGNQSLAHALAAQIGEDRIVTGLPVSGIAYGRDRAVVTCRDGRTLACDDVVLAVPPSTWSKIELEPALPKALAPQMGQGVKYLLPLKGRFWRELGCEQYAMGDGAVSMTWEATDGQEGDGPVVMVAFSGAHAAQTCAAFPADERDRRYAEELERLYPGIAAQVAGKSLFMDWTREPWAMGSYSFPAPGEITTAGPVLRAGLGRLHFAGEHTCYKFIGYMEGALSSGVELAKRLAVRDGVVSSPTPR